MEKVIELSGNVSIYFLSLVAPITGLLLSAYQDGVQKLATNTESEKSKTETNIKDQLKKLGEENEPNTKDIKNNLKKLEKIQRGAKFRLFWLSPKIQLWNLFLPLLISFFIIKFVLDFYQRAWLVVLSSLCLLYFLYSIFKLFSVITEAKKIQDNTKKERELKIIELLSVLSSSKNQLLENVYIKISGKNIDNDEIEVEMLNQIKNDLKLSINNKEMQMAENVEIGLIFDSNFIIEKKGKYSLYVSEDGHQILRYELPSIQGHTDFIPEIVSVTPLKIGNHNVRTFVKGKNVKTCYRNVTLKVAL